MLAVLLIFDPVTHGGWATDERIWGKGREKNEALVDAEGKL